MWINRCRTIIFLCWLSSSSSRSYHALSRTPSYSLRRRPCSSGTLLRVLSWWLHRPCPTFHWWSWSVRWFWHLGFWPSHLHRPILWKGRRLRELSLEELAKLSNHLTLSSLFFFPILYSLQYKGPFTFNMYVLIVPFKIRPRNKLNLIGYL